jgi:hypothetical protein
MAVALAASMTLLLVGCGGGGGTGDSGSSSGSSSGSGTEASGTTDIANPIEVVDSVDDINRQLGLNLQLPNDATLTTCQVISDSLGEVFFSLEGQAYVYRGEHTTTSEDISGLYFDYTSVEEVALDPYVCTMEFNEGGPGYSRWYDEADGVTYSVSVESGASKDKLTDISKLLIASQG